MSLHHDPSAIENYIDFSHPTPHSPEHAKCWGQCQPGNPDGRSTRPDGSQWDGHLLYPASPGAETGSRGQVCEVPTGGRLSNGKPAPERVWLERLTFGRTALRW